MIEQRVISKQQLQMLLDKEESHFFDVKGKGIAPSKLQETFVAFANADGGEIYVGLEDKKHQGNRCNPFNSIEEANAILTVLLEQTSPSVENVNVEFLEPPNGGYILFLSIPKSPKVHYTAQGDCYVRLSAGKVKLKGEKITGLAYSKGSLAYERTPVQTVKLNEIVLSESLKSYMDRVVTSQEPITFLRKQRLTAEVKKKDVPTVGCVLLFDEEPQASIETRCAIKVYRLRTTETEYKREHLVEMPATMNGDIEKVIKDTISKVSALINGASVYEDSKLVTLKYPAEAIKEVLVNAVLHRDYSLNDDIHVKIFDNRIEIASPGKLPGFMTLDNLYEERFSRNPNLVRMLHNLPDPLNHDIGEGLDTVRNELKKAGLIAPEFAERGNSFVVTIKHQKIASVEDVIMDYLSSTSGAIVTNKLVRELSGEADINKVKKALQRLRRDGEIVLVDTNATSFNYRYKKA